MEKAITTVGTPTGGKTEFTVLPVISAEFKEERERFRKWNSKYFDLNEEKLKKIFLQKPEQIYILEDLIEIIEDEPLNTIFLLYLVQLISDPNLRWIMTALTDNKRNERLKENGKELKELKKLRELKKVTNVQLLKKRIEELNLRINNDEKNVVEVKSNIQIFLGEQLKQISIIKLESEISEGKARLDFWITTLIQEKRKSGDFEARNLNPITLNFTKLAFRNWENIKDPTNKVIDKFINSIIFIHDHNRFIKEKKEVKRLSTVESELKKKIDYLFFRLTVYPPKSRTNCEGGHAVWFVWDFINFKFYRFDSNGDWPDQRDSPHISSSRKDKHSAIEIEFKEWFTFRYFSDECLGKLKKIFKIDKIIVPGQPINISEDCFLLGSLESIFYWLPFKWLRLHLPNYFAYEGEKAEAKRMEKLTEEKIETPETAFRTTFSLLLGVLVKKSYDDLGLPNPSNTTDSIESLILLGGQKIDFVKSIYGGTKQINFIDKIKGILMSIKSYQQQKIQHEKLWKNEFDKKINAEFKITRDFEQGAKKIKERKRDSGFNILKAKNIHHRDLEKSEISFNDIQERGEINLEISDQILKQSEKKEGLILLTLEQLEDLKILNEINKASAEISDENINAELKNQLNVKSNLKELLKDPKEEKKKEEIIFTMKINEKLMELLKERKRIMKMESKSNSKASISDLFNKFNL